MLVYRQLPRWTTRLNYPKANREHFCLLEYEGPLFGSLFTVFSFPPYLFRTLAANKRQFIVSAFLTILKSLTLIVRGVNLMSAPIVFEYIILKDCQDNPHLFPENESTRAINTLVLWCLAPSAIMKVHSKRRRL